MSAGINNAIGKPQVGRMSELPGWRWGLSQAVDLIDLLISKMAEIEGLGMLPPGAATILVNSGADIKGGWCHVRGAAVLGSSYDDVAPGFSWSGFNPVLGASK